MRVLLTGAAGQLGQHLIERCPEHIELLASSRRSAHWACDLSKRSEVTSLLESAQPDAIINAAAWTAVDAAEDHESDAKRLNAELPSWLAEWSRINNSGLISYSTDYVFDGRPDNGSGQQSGQGWRETDRCRPQSAYGRSKRLGEQAMLDGGGRILIVRTAWVYSALAGNFLSAILKRAAGGQNLQVVADQIGSPTWAGTLASASWTLLDQLDSINAPTLMHVAGRGAMSWYEFAQRAVRLAQVAGKVPKSVQVAPISSDQWPQQANRPSWSVLDCTNFESWTGMKLPSVENALEECLEQWARHQN